MTQILQNQIVVNIEHLKGLCKVYQCTQASILFRFRGKKMTALKNSGLVNSNRQCYEMTSPKEKERHSEASSESRHLSKEQFGFGSLFFRGHNSNNNENEKKETNEHFLIYLRISFLLQIN